MIFRLPALCFVFLVIGCDEPPPTLTDNQKDEVTEIAEDVAYDTISDTRWRDKIQELESRIEAR
jgi:hypothetical protein